MSNKVLPAVPAEETPLVYRCRVGVVQVMAPVVPVVPPFSHLLGNCKKKSYRVLQKLVPIESSSLNHTRSQSYRSRAYIDFCGMPEVVSGISKKREYKVLWLLRSLKSGFKKEIGEHPADCLLTREVSLELT